MINHLLIYTLGFAALFIAAGVLATLVHETGHILAARHYGWPARLQMFPAWRSAEARALHGKLGLLVFFAADMGDAMRTATDRQIRVAAIAGPAAEFGVVTLGALSMLAWHYFSPSQNAYDGPQGVLVLFGFVWVFAQGVLSPLVNLFPLRSALNDGQYFFRPAESRALLVARTNQSKPNASTI